MGHSKRLLFVFYTQSTKINDKNISLYSAEKHENCAESVNQNIGSYLILHIWVPTEISSYKTTFTETLFLSYDQLFTSVPKIKVNFAVPHMISFFINYFLFLF